MPSVFFPWSGSSLENVVDSEDHLRGFRGLDQNLPLDAETLRDAQLRHAADLSLVHVQADCVATRVVGSLQLTGELGGVVSSVLRNDARQLSQGVGEGLHGSGLLPGSLGCHLVHRLGHQHLAAASPEDCPRLLDGAGEDTESVVQTSLRLPDDLLGGSTQDHGAGLAQRNPRKFQQSLVTDLDLLDQIASSNLDFVRVAECGDDLSTSDESQSLDTIKVCVLDGHDSLVCEQLFGVIVDQLSVDEDVHIVATDHVHFVLHLLLLSQLQLRNLGHVIHLHSGAEHLDLVRVHGSVGDQDLRVLHSLRLVHSNFLVEKETFIQERLLQGSSLDLCNLNGVKVAGALQSENCINSQLREEILVLTQDFGGQSSPGDVHEVLSEKILVLAVISGRLLESFLCCSRGLPPPRDDGLRVNSHLNQLLRLPDELTG